MSIGDYPDGLYRVFIDVVDELAPENLWLIKPLPGPDVFRGMRGNLGAVSLVDAAFKGAITVSLPFSAGPLGNGNLQDNIVGASIVRRKRPHGWVVRAEI